MSRTVGVSALRKTCARLIARLNEEGEPITITKYGRPVARLTPVPTSVADETQIIGALKGSVLGYDDPFAPAIDVAELEGT